MKSSFERWSRRARAVIAAWSIGCGGIAQSPATAIGGPAGVDAAIIDSPAGRGAPDAVHDVGTTSEAMGVDAAEHLVFCPSGPSFVKMTPVTLGNAPYFVRAGDFNGDGHLDVAVPNYGDGTLSVLLGDGAGRLNHALASPYAVGSTPCSEAIGDFNGDGLADIALSNSGGGSISLLLGRAAGPLTTAAGSPFATGSQSSQSCGPAAGDFNGDGNLDVAVPVGGSLQVLLGNGRGGLSAGSSVSVPGTLQSAVAADFNRDGVLDVAASNYTGDSVNVFLGDGHGGLASAAGSPWSVGSSTASLAAGDFNRDGQVDLAVAGYGAGNVIVLLGNGQGGFAIAAGSPIFVGTNPTDIAIGDFDGDRNLDLAVTVNGNASISVLRGNGTGTFASATRSPMGVGPYPGSLTAGDFNEDGKVDLALTNNIPGTWTVSLLLNTCAP
jgi:hypothetical protein